MAVSVVVFVAVVILNKKILPVPEVIPDFVYRLPKLNAMLNGICTLMLLLSLYFIKQRNIELHRKVNIIAFGLSSLFLLSYITYHWMAQETTFPVGNPLRTPYLVILISHIILAAAVLPLILLSFWYGLKSQEPGGEAYIQRHRRLTRWSYPVWLYVTVTGVVVYLMISPFYVFQN
ncbi:MAG: rane protein [Bacteroidetes bacterium]|nr:rane protein [Bacteroidota bacterium]